MTCSLLHADTDSAKGNNSCCKSAPYVAVGDNACIHHSDEPMCALQSLVEAQDIDTAWEELASIQQAGLDAALAAKSKPRKPKQAQASTDPANIPSIANGHPASAPNGADTASSAAAETVSAATTANAQPTAPAAAVPPAPEQASQRDQQQGHQQSAALTNGHSAPSASGIGPGTGGVQLQDSQENMAANSQQSEHASQVKQQDSVIEPGARSMS